MEPARYALTLRGQGPDVADRLQTVLNRHGAPPVAVELSGVELTFVCETWEPILLSRVRDAVAAELGEDAGS
jgi:hypothetical protein